MVVTRKHCTQKKLGSAVLWLLAFPEESSPNFAYIVLGEKSDIIFFFFSFAGDYTGRAVSSGDERSCPPQIAYDMVI